ncbi:MAG: site-specific integrase [Clostridia bacterium]|nr:site-specific integrase [Clostridia bacterium]
MTGSIQEKNGKLYAVVSYRGSDGTPKRKWVSTGLAVRGNKKKAESMLQDIIEAHLELEETESEAVLFVDYLKEWLMKKKLKVQLSTWEGYEIYVNRHIIPYFEPLGLTIDQVTPKHIQDYYESRLTCQRPDHKAGGLKPVSVKKHAPVLNQVFEAALIEELINRNPVTMVPLPKQEKKEPTGKFMTAEEANRLLEAFRGHELQPLIYITLYYGLRRSEVLGLKWDAIDFEENTLRIQFTVVKQKTIIEKPATKSMTSRRVYPLLPEVKELLLRLQDKKKQDRIDFGSAYKESDYIFVWADGTPYRPDYVTRAFGKVLEKKGLPHIRFHDIRHSTASILYDKGWDLKDIQEWLGHADIGTTGNIYTHISKLRKETIGKDLGSTFKL